MSIGRISRIGRVGRVGGGVVAFDPTTISGAVARWTAGVANYSDAGITPAVADGTVQQVNDRIGSFTASQAVAGSRPTLRLVSGTYEWEFDGTADFLGLADGSILAAYPHTVAAKVRMLGTAAGAIFQIGAASDAGGIVSGWGNTDIDTAGDNLVALFAGVRHLQGANDGTASGELTVVWRYADNGATTTMRTNGTGYTAASNTGSEPAALDDTASIGRQNGTAAPRYLTGNCRIQDLVIYNISLSDADVATLIANW